MRKIIAAIFVICLIVTAVTQAARAEAVSGADSVSSIPAEEHETGNELFTMESKGEAGTGLADDELCLVRGQAMKSGLPDVRIAGDYRIILWDEGGDKGDAATSRMSGQSITIISRQGGDGMR